MKLLRSLFKALLVAIGWDTYAYGRWQKNGDVQYVCNKEGQTIGEVEKLHEAGCVRYRARWSAKPQVTSHDGAGFETEAKNIVERKARYPLPLSLRAS